MQFGLKRLFMLTAAVGVLLGLLRIGPAATFTTLMTVICFASARWAARAARPDTPPTRYGCLTLIAVAMSVACVLIGFVGLAFWLRVIADLLASGRGGAR